MVTNSLTLRSRVRFYLPSPTTETNCTSKQRQDWTECQFLRPCLKNMATSIAYFLVHTCLHVLRSLRHVEKSFERTEVNSPSWALSQKPAATASHVKGPLAASLSSTNLLGPSQSNISITVLLFNAKLRFPPYNHTTNKNLRHDHIHRQNNGNTIMSKMGMGHCVQ